MLTLPNGFSASLYEERARRCALILPEVVDTKDKELIKLAISWLKDLLDAMNGCTTTRWVKRIDATIRILDRLEGSLHA